MSFGSAYDLMGQIGALLQRVSALEQKFSNQLNPLTVVGVVGNTPYQQQAVWGAATLTWPGASAASNVLTIAHGLGRTPQIVLTGEGRTGLGGLHVETDISAPPNATSIGFQGYAVDGTPSTSDTATLWWLALG